MSARLVVIATAALGHPAFPDPSVLAQESITEQRRGEESPDTNSTQPMGTLKSFGSAAATQSICESGQCMCCAAVPREPLICNHVP